MQVPQSSAPDVLVGVGQELPLHPPHVARLAAPQHGARARASAPARDAAAVPALLLLQRGAVGLQAVHRPHQQRLLHVLRACAT